MPAISNIRLVDALVQVGPAKTQLTGWGDDMFTLAPLTEVGAILGGVQGDVMLVQRKQNAWTFTANFFTAGPGITLLNNLSSTLGVFDFSCVYGAFSLVGFATMLNPGEMAAGLSANNRTITLGVAKVSGDTDAAPGNILQII